LFLDGNEYTDDILPGYGGRVYLYRKRDFLSSSCHKILHCPPFLSLVK